MAPVTVIATPPLGPSTLRGPDHRSPSLQPRNPSTLPPATVIHSHDLPQPRRSNAAGTHLRGGSWLGGCEASSLWQKDLENVKRGLMIVMKGPRGRQKWWMPWKDREAEVATVGERWSVF
ncbi:hypothetical protein V499_03901 [Pseudogymnoascus sp. VKM F-103]|nr:hypothetical protein V499_03901 [Pseudogymnoascus sp. VKM F-103]